MTRLLDEPVRVDEQADRLYFFNGQVSVDLNGSEAERKRVLAFLAQAPNVARALLKMVGNHPGDCICRACAVLVDVGLLAKEEIKP